MGGRIRHLKATAGLAVAVTMGLVGACAPQPPPDDFFTPPTTSDTTPPAKNPETTPPLTSAPGAGELIRSRPSVFTSDLFNQTPNSSVDSYQVMYRSTSALGASNTVSGTVLVPKAPWTGEGSRPIVSVGVGTRGVADSCAPSWTMTQGWDYEAFEYEMLLDRGWAVAVTDMVGLGTPGTHTYEVGREQGTAMLDIVRAAYQIPGVGLDPNGPVGLMGYSQGGTTAAWGAELEGTYAPELNVKGTAAAGVPADLLAVAKALDGGPFIGLAMMAALGYNAAYPELNLESFMNERGLGLIERSENLCITSYQGFIELMNVGNSWFVDYLKDRTKSPLDDPQWVKRLDENRLGRNVPAAPVLLQHARFDQMVAYPQAEQLHKDWCDAGANVTWRTHLLAEHVLGMVFSIDENLDFLAARFADKPVESNC
ncbi:MAG: hypothetical protein KDB26_13175 [Microthrixaceae bacterium]|nr:hypothetical protein [Microthrixaceae bacterium]